MALKHGNRLALAAFTTLVAILITCYALTRRTDVNLGGRKIASTIDAQAPRVSEAEIPLVAFENIDPAVARAIEQARQEVAKNRRSADAWGNLGMVLLAHEFDEPARLAFVEAVKLAPRNPKWPYLQGRSFDSIDSEEAVAPLAAAVKLADAEHDAPILRLVELLTALNRLDEAEQRLQSFLRAHPDHARANLDMARLLTRRGDLVRATEHVRMAENHDATRKAAHQLLGQILLRQSRADDARKQQAIADQLPEFGWPDPYYEEVLAKRTGLKAMLVQADRLFGAGKAKETIPLLELAVREYPDSDWAHVLLGRSLIRERRLPEAEQKLRRAIGLSPESVEAQFRLGVAIYLQKRPKEAADWFRRAIKLKPDFTMAHYNLGHCLVDLKDISGAIEAFQATANSDPMMYDAHAVLGTLLAQQGRTDEAISHWRQAIVLRPNDAKAKAELQKLSGSSMTP